MATFPESVLTPRERSEAVITMFDRFTSNELASYIFRFSNKLPFLEDPDEIDRTRHQLNWLLSIAHKKGFLDDELIEMQERNLAPFSWEDIKKRKVINIADLRRRRRLAVGRN